MKGKLIAANTAVAGFIALLAAFLLLNGTFAAAGTGEPEQTIALANEALAELGKVQTKAGTASYLQHGKEKVTEIKTRAQERKAAEEPPPEEPPPPPPVEPSTAIDWGARIQGNAYGETSDAPWNYVAWDRFESEAGRKITLLAWGQPFGNFALSPLEKTQARGARSLVSMDLPVDAVNRGEKDATIDAMGTLLAGKGEVLLRLGWECNGNWYAWGQHPGYVSAYRRVFSRLWAKGATNVKSVWNVNILGGSTVSDFASMYPGDEYVQYTSIDGYNWGSTSAENVFRPTYNRMLEVAPRKLIIIGETAAVANSYKPTWITELLTQTLPSMPQITGFSWFNSALVEGGVQRTWPIGNPLAAASAFKSGIASGYYR